MPNITVNVETVYQRINAAVKRAGRNPAEITLVAVTKTHSLETVIAAYRAGLRHFGENRVQEGRTKVMEMAGWLACNLPEHEAPTWHLIGHLQSRQVGAALGQFSLMHAVDSLKLAQRLNRLAERDDYPPVEILLECNVSGEASKYGFALDAWTSDSGQLNTFLESIAHMAKLDRVVIRGLMTMAPLGDHPEETRPVFQSLAGLRARLQKEMPEIAWQHLSMGMTDDFEVAIEEGATIIRVGRALFGERLTC
ncbi:MAG: YggS family pyridoxal phosphate-dependent enzyme [Anaerolineae bacterium]|nr:YggS family pyridoxal phosphate-dependent enzyme [Anaerolineae bacterium]